MQDPRDADDHCTAHTSVGKDIFVELVPEDVGEGTGSITEPHCVTEIVSYEAMTRRAEEWNTIEAEMERRA